MPRKGPIRRREEGRGNLDHDLTMFTCDAVSSHNHSPQHSWLTNGLSSHEGYTAGTGVEDDTRILRCDRRVLRRVNDAYLVVQQLVPGIAYGVGGL